MALIIHTLKFVKVMCDWHVLLVHGFKV